MGGFCCARLCEGFGEVSVLDEYFDAEKLFWLGWTDICPSVFEKWPRELCKYPLLVALAVYASGSVDRRGQAHRARSFCRAALKHLRAHPHCEPRATCERGAASSSTELCSFWTAWTV